MTPPSRGSRRIVALLGAVLAAGAAAAVAGRFAWNAGWEGRALQALSAGGVLLVCALPALELFLERYGPPRGRVAWRWTARLALATCFLIVAAFASVAVAMAARSASIRESERRGLIVIEALELARERTGAFPATLDGLIDADGQPLPVPSIDRLGWSYRNHDDGFCLGFSTGWLDWSWWCSEGREWRRI